MRAAGIVVRSVSIYCITGKEMLRGDWMLVYRVSPYQVQSYAISTFCISWLHQLSCIGRTPLGASWIMWRARNALDPSSKFLICCLLLEEREILLYLLCFPRLLFCLDPVAFVVLESDDYVCDQYHVSHNRCCSSRPCRISLYESDSCSFNTTSSYTFVDFVQGQKVCSNGADHHRCCKA